MLTGNCGSVQNFEGVSASFIEPVINNYASEYLASHMDKLHDYVLRLNEVDPEKIDDLLQDVWISLYKDEMNGKCYDMQYQDSSNIITIEQYVYGRIKKYAHNSRYHKNGSQKGCKFEEVASSCDSTDTSTLDSFQKAYALASTCDDDIERIELEMTLVDNITYCMKFEKQIGFNLISFLRNIEGFLSGTFDTTLFEPLKQLVRNNLDFGGAFRSIIKTYQISGCNFDKILACI